MDGKINNDAGFNLVSTKFQNIRKLNYATIETISKIRFCSSWYVLASSWDGLVTLIDACKNSVTATYSHNSPVLDCCFVDGFRSYSGSLDSKIISYDFISENKTCIGQHENAVRCLEYSDDGNLLITGGWDSKVKLWDTRSKTCVKSLLQPDRVYALSNPGDKIVVGTAGRKIYVWDLKNLDFILQRRESTLKTQTRCIESFPDQTGYLVSSINGRVALEYFDPKLKKKSCAFKVHREITREGIERSYPVNAISYHPMLNYFATAGSDGRVNIWDFYLKRRIGRSRKFPAPLTSICYDSTGKIMAIASSILYEDQNESNTGPSSNAIYLLNLN